jgi:hypothetical protein
MRWHPVWQYARQGAAATEPKWDSRLVFGRMQKVLAAFRGRGNGGDWSGFREKSNVSSKYYSSLHLPARTLQQTRRCFLRLPGQTGYEDSRGCFSS